MEPTPAAMKQLAKVEAVVRQLQDEVQRLVELRADLNGGVNALGRRAVKMTPQRRAQLKLQGEYMGYMRNLKPGQKKQVKAMKERRGIEAGIRMAKRMAGGI